MSRDFEAEIEQWAEEYNELANKCELMEERVKLLEKALANQAVRAEKFKEWLVEEGYEVTNE